LGRGGARPALALLAALALALSTSACGASGNGDVTLTIGSRGTPEEEVLGHVYAQALRAAGYEVNGDFGIETEYREAPLEEVHSGRISGYPEHVDAALKLLLVKEEDLPNDSQRAYGMAEARFEKEGLTAFPPTPYSLSRPVGLLRKTAEERDLRTVSDLRGQAEEMRLLGFSNCHFALDCLSGIERYYRIYFKAIFYMYTKQELHGRYRVLEDGEFDASILYSTDGRLAGGKSKFVILKDDKRAFPAGNAIFVTSPKVVEEAGPDFEETITAAQKGMTLPVMQRLDAEVELEEKDPAKVAAGYLKQVGLAG
jgi:osmoprotectant transport system substrate-binding protein